MMPMLLRIRGIDNNRKRFGLWLPLFLVWIIVLPLLIIPAPIILLAALLMWPFGYGYIVMQAYFTIFKILWCLSGLEFNIESGHGTFFITMR